MKKVSTKPNKGLTLPSTPGPIGSIGGAYGTLITKPGLTKPIKKGSK